MEIYKSKYLTLNFFQNTLHIEMIWSSETVNMTEKDYKQELLTYVKLVEKHIPKKILVDTTDLKFAIVPDLQIWTNENILTRSHAVGLNKDAFIISKELIIELSAQQIMDEEVGKKKSTQYFDNKKDALQWLLN